MVQKLNIEDEESVGSIDYYPEAAGTYYQLQDSDVPHVTVVTKETKALWYHSE